MAWGDLRAVADDSWDGGARPGRQTQEKPVARTVCAADGAIDDSVAASLQQQQNDSTGQRDTLRNLFDAGDGDVGYV